MTGAERGPVDWRPRAKVVAGAAIGILAAALAAAVPELRAALDSSALPGWAIVALTTALTSLAGYLKTDDDR